MIHLPNLPLVDKAISIGWTFSTVVLVPEQTSSWTPILDQQRITERTDRHRGRYCAIASPQATLWQQAGHHLGRSVVRDACYQPAFTGTSPTLGSPPPYFFEK